MRKILEIGHGGFPIGSTLDYFLRSKPKDIEYHGIDLPPDEAHSVEEFFMFFGGLEPEDTYPQKIRNLKSIVDETEPKDFYLHEGDARELPFTDSSYQEVHMHYVVTQPDVQRSDSEQMIKEAKRVLSDDGHLIIVGELQASAFKAEGASYKIAKEILAKNNFSEVYDGVNHLENKTVFSKTIKELVNCRNTDGEGYFVLVARK